MSDMVVASWDPYNWILSYLLGLGTKRAIEKIREWRKKQKFWKDHFPEFFEEDVQTVIGTSKLIELSLPQLKEIKPKIRQQIAEIGSYDYLAAKKLLIPSIRNCLCLYFNKVVKEQVVSELKLKRNKNIIEYGGWVSSELAEKVLMTDRCRFRFGLKNKSGEIVWEITPKQLQEHRRHPFESDWIIVDVFERRVLFEPVKRVNGTYTTDGTIITRIESPISKKRDILCFMGTHILGVYYGDIIFRNLQYLGEFDYQLHKNNIQNDSFQAVIKLNFEKYRWKDMPQKNVLHNIEIIDVKKI